MRDDMTLFWLVFVLVAWIVAGCAIGKPETLPMPDSECTRECAAWWMRFNRSDKDPIAIRCECRTRSALVEGGGPCLKQL